MAFFIALASPMPAVYGILGLIGLLAATATALSFDNLDVAAFSRGTFGANGFLVGLAVATYTDAYTVVGSHDGTAFVGSLMAAHVFATAGIAALSVVIAVALVRAWADRPDPSDLGLDSIALLVGDIGGGSPPAPQKIGDGPLAQPQGGGSSGSSSPPGTSASLFRMLLHMQRVALRRVAALRARAGDPGAPQPGLTVGAPGLPTLTLPFVLAALALLAAISGVHFNGPLGSGAGGGARQPGGIAGGDVGDHYFRLASGVRPPWLPVPTVAAAAVSGQVNASSAEAAASAAAAAALLADVWRPGSGVPAMGCFPSSLPGVPQTGDASGCTATVLAAVLRGLSQVRICVPG